MRYTPHEIDVHEMAVVQGVDVARIPVEGLLNLTQRQQVSLLRSIHVDVLLNAIPGAIARCLAGVVFGQGSGGVVEVATFDILVHLVPLSGYLSGAYLAPRTAGSEHQALDALQVVGEKGQLLLVEALQVFLEVAQRDLPLVHIQVVQVGENLLAVLAHHHPPAAAAAGLSLPAPIGVTAGFCLGSTGIRKLGWIRQRAEPIGLP